MTNDTKAATDEQVEEIQLSYAHFNKIEIEDLAALCIRINSDRARISALQSEIAALKAAPELVEAVKDVLEDAEPIVGYEDEERMVETPLILRLRSAYNSALSAQEPKVSPDCGGDGWVSETVQVDVDEYGDAIGEQIQADCPKCEGTGVIKVREA